MKSYPKNAGQRKTLSGVRTRASVFKCKIFTSPWRDPEWPPLI